MSSKPKVLMIVTLDTKSVEAQFVRQTVEAEGVDVVHLDASIRNSTIRTSRSRLKPSQRRPARRSRRFATRVMMQVPGSNIAGAVKCELEATYEAFAMNNR